MGVRARTAEMADVRFALRRLASLKREQLEEFVIKAAKELKRKSEAAECLNAALANASPVPVWAACDILLDADLCAAIISYLDVSDSSAASVCHLWHREWREMLVRRKVMRETSWRLKCNGLPRSFLKLPDNLLIYEPDRLVMYTENGPVDAFKLEHNLSPAEVAHYCWYSDFALGDDGCVFHFDELSLKLRRLRQNQTDGVLEEDVAVNLRTLTDKDRELEGNSIGRHRNLILLEGTLYVFRELLVEAFDAKTLATLPARGFHLNGEFSRLPVGKFEPSHLLLIFTFDLDFNRFGIAAVSRSGEMVQLPERPEMELESWMPFACDVCDDRLYVLNYNRSHKSGVELHSLTLDGRPTQSALKLTCWVVGESWREFDWTFADFQLSASPQGIYILDIEEKEMRRVILGGKEGNDFLYSSSRISLAPGQSSCLGATWRGAPPIARERRCERHLRHVFSPLSWAVAVSGQCECVNMSVHDVS